MYVSDQKTSNILAILALVIGPWLGVSKETWGWMLDALLLLSIFWIGRNGRHRGFQHAAFLLVLGYGIAFLLNGVSSIENMGFIPWAGLVTVWGLKRNWPQSAIVFGSLVTAGIMGLIPALSLLNYGVSQESIQELINGIINQYRQAGMLEAFQQQGMSEVEIINMLEQAVSYFLLLTPGLAAISGIVVWGAVYYFIARWFPEPGNEYRPFIQWRLPWYALWGMNLAIVSYLIGDQFQWPLLRGFGINLMLVYGTITLVLGSAIFSYFLRSSWMSRFVKAMIILASFIYINVTVVGLILLGLFDLVSNFRRLPVLEKDNE